MKDNHSFLHSGGQPNASFTVELTSNNDIKIQVGDNYQNWWDLPNYAYFPNQADLTYMFMPCVFHYYIPNITYTTWVHDIRNEVSDWYQVVHTVPRITNLEVGPNNGLVTKFDGFTAAGDLIVSNVPMPVIDYGYPPKPNDSSNAGGG